MNDLFDWVYKTSSSAPFFLSTVEAPHYRRFWMEQELACGKTIEELQKQAKSKGFGVRDGNGVIFVSHTGDVYPAGFLPYPLLGNVKETGLETIYRENPDLIELRNADHYEGGCGHCDYRWVCGGSRARAYALSGNPMGSDTLCPHAVS
ncbi:MAG: SPASM domain-containing protein [Myxococcales bacterium]|nr:MAG: SPASM domain-containing protein [Myxococcales bacterium]